MSCEKTFCLVEDELLHALSASQTPSAVSFWEQTARTRRSLVANIAQQDAMLLDLCGCLVEWESLRLSSDAAVTLQQHWKQVSCEYLTWHKSRVHVELRMIYLFLASFDR